MIDFLQELQIHADQYDPKMKGNDVWIKCPFHSQGQERTPSCRINLQKGKYPIGFFYCYGCGKHGNWNDLAQIIPTLPLLDGQELKDQDLLMTRLTPAQRQSLYGEEIKSQIDFGMMVPWDRKKFWRKIDGRLISDLGGKQFCNKRNEIQLFLPCYQNLELKGGIQCYLEKIPGRTSYINTSGPWVKKSLFPFDFTRKMMKKKKILALVEGPRDALNMIQYGFPALAILGSKNWSSLKSNLVRILNPKKLILAFDNDEAGQSAFNTVSKSFSDLTNLSKIEFESNQDPADLTKEQIQKLYKYFMED